MGGMGWGHNFFYSENMNSFKKVTKEFSCVVDHLVVTMVTVVR